jgi:hypothetical protein
LNFAGVFYEVILSVSCEEIVRVFCEENLTVFYEENLNVFYEKILSGYVQVSSNVYEWSMQEYGTCTSVMFLENLRNLMNIGVLKMNVCVCVGALNRNIVCDRESVYVPNVISEERFEVDLYEEYLNLWLFLALHPENNCPCVPHDSCSLSHAPSCVQFPTTYHCASLSP